MNDINQLKDQQRDKHPGFDSYLECMTRSLFKGISAFLIIFSGTHFAQKLIPPKVYPLKYRILTSSLLSCGIAYKVTADRSKSCQAAWMAVEEKHTALSEENSDN